MKAVKKKVIKKVKSTSQPVNVPVTIEDLISNGAFFPESRFPKRLTKLETFISKAVKDTTDPDLLTKKIEEHKKALDAYNKKVSSFKAEERRLLTNFKQKALREVALADHPRASDIYEFAYKHSNAGSPEECLMNTLNLLRELSDLFLESPEHIISDNDDGEAEE